MPTQIQEQTKAVQARIFAETYYNRLWCEVLINEKMRPSGIDTFQYDDKRLVLACHYFWEALPDSPEIRRVPFFTICDIAQNVFDL